jgi:ribosomal protein S18 acetylase RimI-like enzyme
MELIRENPTIVTWSKLSPADQARLMPEFREVFFLTSSRKNFASTEEREKFWRGWTEYYFVNEPQHIYVALSPEGFLQGYLTGSQDSRKAQPEIESRIPSYACFADLFGGFPAHLHINCHPNAQRTGLGRHLIETFVRDLRSSSTAGLHIVTSPGEDNVLFYRRLGFTQEVGRNWNGYPLLFMGRKL